MRETIATPTTSPLAPPPLTRARKSAPALPTATGLGRLMFAASYAIDWEILIYRRPDKHWEACFFKWNSHHEHLVGASLIEARDKAKERIRVLEGVAPPARHR